MFGCGKPAQKSATLLHTSSVFTTAPSYQTQVHVTESARTVTLTLCPGKCPVSDSGSPFSKTIQKNWLCSLHLMTARCSSGNHWRSVTTTMLPNKVLEFIVVLSPCLIQIDLVYVLIQSIYLPSVQVENLDTFQGHRGAVRGLVCRGGVPEFLTVSEDCSLRCWTWKTGTPCVSTPVALSFNTFPR